MKDNKKGWYQKYIIHKADGSPVDPDAIYMVLRLDTDPHAMNAALKYADSCENDNPLLAQDIRRMLLENTD